MSTLWTPSGEHPVPRAPGGGAGGAEGPGQAGRGRDGAGGSGRSASGEDAGEGRHDWRRARSEGREPTPEEIEQAQAEIDAVREQLLGAPVEIVISNHAMGLWELAALHLSQRPARLADARLAIDALSALVEGLRGRLGEAEGALVDGLAQMRMAFVQIANAEEARQAAGDATPRQP